MSRKILASILVLLLLLSACSANPNSSQPDGSQVPEQAHGSTSPAEVEEHEEPAESSPTDDAPDVPDAPEEKTTLVLGGIGLTGGPLAGLVNDFNAENTNTRW